MTDDKVVSDGPYFISEEFDYETGSKWFMINGPGIEDPMATLTQDYTEATTMVKIRNDSYDEGRKKERERCAKIAENTNVNYEGDGWDRYGGSVIAENIRGGQDGN